MYSPSQGQIDRGTFKLIDGVWHQRCSGPAHEEPTYLPATEKYFHRRKSGERNGHFVSRCRLCINWGKLKSPGSEHGYVLLAKAKPYYEEAVNRMGLTELSRRAGISESHIQSVLRGRQLYVRKLTLRKVMLELVSSRRKGEHIGPNARWRNERRMFRGHDRCVGCGTPKSNYTKGCEACWDRLYRLHYRGHISDEEYRELRATLLELETK